MTSQAESVSEDDQAGARVTPPSVIDRRLRTYRRLSRLLFSRSYTVKVLLLAFATIHIPLLAMVAYILFVADLTSGAVWPILAVSLAATLIGAGLATAGLWVLLTPIISASQTLIAYRRDGIRPALPTDIDDEGGHLLAHIQHTLVDLDGALAHATDAASRDSLTGLLNRREGERRLRDELAMARLSGTTLVVLILDADGLKDVNDRWGHAAGDACIKQLAAIIAREVGEDGCVARWGGDEFVVLCPGGVAAAQALLERIKATLASTPIALPSGARTTITICGGMASSTSADTPEDLIERADAALYRRKQARGASITQA
jgi:diguanylate cyclase (GGDEF)-like protein